MTTRQIDALSSAGAVGVTKELILGHTSDLYRTTLDAAALLITGERRLIRPAASDFTTWMNQETSAIADVSNYGVKLYRNSVVSDSSHRYNGKFRALPGGTSWAIVCKVVKHGNSFLYNSEGVAIRDSVGGKICSLVFDWKDSGYMMMHTWNNATSEISDSTTYVGYIPYAGPLNLSAWIRIVFDNTNYYWDISPDGIVWARHNLIAKSFFANTPDQFGMVINPRGHYLMTEDEPVGITMLHYNEE
jgi:hypothetical protein